MTIFYINSVNAQQIESLHSIKAGIYSITYSYEHALGKQFTINTEVGSDWSWSGGSNNFEINFSPVLKIEPRLYYSVKRRFEIGRFTNNSASFFCVTTSVQSTILKKYSSGYLSVIPKWGFRRAMGNHFIFETQIGGGVYFYRSSTQFSPGLDIKFGYVF